MPGPFDVPRVLAGSGGAAAIAAAGMLAHRRLRRAIASDPESRALQSRPPGVPGVAISADGTSLHVETFGPESGSPLILIHGWTETIPFWTYVLRGLERHGVRAIAYDLRGHGQSSAAAGGDYSLARFGEDLEAVVQAFVPEGRPAVLAGHSLGAMSIAAWAESHDVGPRVGAAALINTGVGELVAESLLMPLPVVAKTINEWLGVRAFLGARTPLPRFSTPISFGLIRYVAFGPHPSPAQVAFYERMLVATPPDVRAEVGIAMSRMDLYPALERLIVPTAVIAGAEDRLTPPSHGQRIAERLPQLHSLTVLDDVGHMGPLESPAEIVHKLSDLLAVVERGREFAP